MDTEIVKVTDVRIGDLMDLEHDDIAHTVMTETDVAASEVDLCIVCEIEREPGWFLIGWEGIAGLAAYPEAHTVVVGGHDARYDSE